MTSKRRSANAAALLTAAVFRDAGDADRALLTGELDNYVIDVVGDRQMTLADVCDAGEDIVYVAYPEGRTVKHLARFDGKDLWRKQDDIVSLQSSWLSQQGRLVVEAKRADDPELGVREFDVISLYLTSKGVGVTDLTQARPIEGQERSRPLRRESRNLVGVSIKFVEFPGLAANRGWRIGTETWLNLANPDIAICYDILNRDVDESATLVASLFVKMVALDFQGALVDLVSELHRAQSDHG